jgi:gas vesicle protein
MKFLFGLGLGYAIGLLVAPAPGTQTRDELAQRAQEWAELPRQKMAEAYEAGRERAGEVGRRVGQSAYESAAEKTGLKPEQRKA